MKKYIILAFIALVWFLVMFWAAGVDNFGYIEQQATFLWHWPSVAKMLIATGGIAQCLALFLTQFFVHPWLGAVITAMVLAVSAMAMAVVLKGFMPRTWATTPLAILPTAAQAMLIYNVNYMYSGAVAYMLMALLLAWYVRMGLQSPQMRLAYGSLSSMLLYFVAGPVALLLAVMLCMIDFRRHGWKGCYMLVAFVWIYAMALYSVKLGYYGNMGIALLPDAYFTHRLPAPNVIWMPWILTIAAAAIAWIAGLIKSRTSAVIISIFAVSLVAALAFSAYALIGNVNRWNEQFKRINLLVAHEQWPEVIAATEGSGTNLLFQNARNLALAETGRLGDELFDQPCYDIRSIYQQGDKTPYISMLMSDVYYSMGHIALAQRYAFEANQMMGNMSPRMLQRLVQTNLIYSQYGVAAKYLRLLSHTLYYRDWARDQHRFVGNDTAVEQDAELGAKRRCLFPDNRFAAERGLDDDLKQIIKANPEHKATREYLGSLYLLSKDLPRFVETVDSFYNGESLPRCFEQGVLQAWSENDSILARYGISDSAKELYRQFRASPQSMPHTFWYFYRYVQ